MYAVLFILAGSLCIKVSCEQSKHEINIGNRHARDIDIGSRHGRSALSRDIPTWVKDMYEGKVTTFKPPIPLPPLISRTTTNSWFDELTDVEDPMVWLTTVFNKTVTIEEIREELSKNPGDVTVIRGVSIPNYLIEFMLERIEKGYQQTTPTSDINKVLNILGNGKVKLLGGLLMDALDVAVSIEYPVAANLTKEEIVAAYTPPVRTTTETSQPSNITLGPSTELCKQSVSMYSGNNRVSDHVLSMVEWHFEEPVGFGNVTFRDGVIEFTTDVTDMRCSAIAAPNMRQILILMKIPNLAIRYKFTLAFSIHNYINGEIEGSVDIELENQQMESKVGVAKERGGECEYTHMGFKIKLTLDDQEQKVTYSLNDKMFATIGKIFDWQTILKTFITAELLRREEWTMGKYYADFHNKLLMTAKETFRAQNEPDLCDL